MSISASLLVYDIPVGARNPNGSPLANPSPELRRVGFRCNLSAWVIPNQLIPYTLLNDLRIARVDWELIKFDVSEAPALLKMARKALRQEIRSAVKRARESEEKAAGRTAESEEIDPERVENSYLRSTRSIVRRATELVKDLQRSAEAFGIEPQELDILHAFGSLHAITETARIKAKTFADAMSTARRMGMDGQAMADGVDANGNGVILILADWLEERDVDVSALRHAFLDHMPGRSQGEDE